MKNMRDDQVQDFFKELKRFLKMSGDIPAEIKEEISQANGIALQVTPTVFAIQFLDESGVAKTVKFELHGTDKMATRIYPTQQLEK